METARFVDDLELKRELELGVVTGPFMWVNSDFDGVLNWHKEQESHKTGYHLRSWISSKNPNSIKEIANSIPSSMITDDVYHFPNAKWTGLGGTSSTGNGEYLVTRLMTMKTLSFAPHGYNPFNKG
jgi:hypothetical protein